MADIVLSPGTERVLVREVPRMLALAIHPDGTSDAQAITNLMKQANNVNVIPAPRMEPLSEDDWSLLGNIWRHLPTFREGIDEAAWVPYAEAFEAASYKPEWLLIALWREGPLNTQISRVFTEDEHKKAIHIAITQGELIALTNARLPLSRMVIGEQIESAFLSVAALTAYAMKFGIGVQVAKAPALIVVPHKSPREYKPWETLPQFFDFIAGVYMYEQAAREIADAQGWSDSKLEAFQTEMAIDIKAGVLQVHSRKTGFVIGPDSLNEIPLVTVAGVNKWLEKRGVAYRWTLKSAVSKLLATPMALFSGQGFSKEAQKMTTLTKYLELDTWTPLIASLLVCGIQPPQDCIEMPNGAFGLDGGFITGNEDPFHYARRVLEIWNSRVDAPLKVRPADFIEWCKTKGINTEWLRDVPTNAMQLSESQSLPMSPLVAKAEPLPLTTGDIAFCFAGLHWDTEAKWKRPLGDKPKWIRPSIAIPGQKGVRETRWNPVCLAGALITLTGIKPNILRGRFQSNLLLKPWFDAWKTYEADNFDNV